jgi:mRNA interferase RelE/StbE
MVYPLARFYQDSIFIVCCKYPAYGGTAPPILIISLPVYTVIMHVLLSREAASYLKRLNAPQRERIAAALGGLAKEPPEGDIIKLTGQDGYRARVGDLRILFKIDDNSVRIHSIVPRGQAYNKKEKKK